MNYVWTLCAVPLPSTREIKGHACDGVRAVKLRNQLPGVKIPDPDDLRSFRDNDISDTSFHGSNKTPQKCRFYSDWLFRGNTHRCLAAADNLTKFLAEAAANHGLLVRDNKSTVRVRPVKREEKWEAGSQTATWTAGLLWKWLHRNRNRSMQRFSQLNTGNRRGFFCEHSTEAQPPTFSSGTAQPYPQRQRKEIL